MRITICGSIAHYNEMLELQRELEKLGHTVYVPDSEFTNSDGAKVSIPEAYLLRQNGKAEDTWLWSEKKRAMIRHFDKIRATDAILVANYHKKGISNYIGANTLIEMVFALYENKKIFLLNEIPDISYKEEIYGCLPVCIHGNLSSIA